MRSWGARAALLALSASLPAAVLAAPPLAVHHVQVSVADADALAQWYVAKLGFKVVKRLATPTVKVVWIDIPGFRLGLAQVPGSRRPPDNSLLPPDDVRIQGYRQIHFSVPGVDAAYEALLADGVRFVVPPKSYDPPAIRLATLVDPEGNLISLYEDLDPANALTRAVP